MKLLFVDEAVKERGANRYFFELCGLMIDEEKLYGLEEA